MEGDYSWWNNLCCAIQSFLRSLYWLVNFLLTYWFISDVLPTLPRNFPPWLGMLVSMVSTKPLVWSRHIHSWWKLQWCTYFQVCHMFVKRIRSTSCCGSVVFLIYSQIHFQMRATCDRSTDSVRIVITAAAIEPWVTHYLPRWSLSEGLSSWPTLTSTEHVLSISSVQHPGSHTLVWVFRCTHRRIAQLDKRQLKPPKPPPAALAAFPDALTDREMTRAHRWYRFCAEARATGVEKLLTL